MRVLDSGSAFYVEAGSPARPLDFGLGTGRVGHAEELLAHWRRIDRRKRDDAGSHVPEFLAVVLHAMPCPRCGYELMHQKGGRGVRAGWLCPESGCEWLFPEAPGVCVVVPIKEKKSRSGFEPRAVLAFESVDAFIAWVNHPAFHEMTVKIIGDPKADDDEWEDTVPIDVELDTYQSVDHYAASGFRVVVRSGEEDEDGFSDVTLEAYGPGVEQWADWNQSVLGSSWETARDMPDFAYTIVYDAPDLDEQLMAEGYTNLDLSQWYPPDEEGAG